ncbi:hypothetical protein VTO42DRAFT_6911 [Malbranchea cinnamomea]
MPSRMSLMCFCQYAYAIFYNPPVPKRDPAVDENLGPGPGACPYHINNLRCEDYTEVYLCHAKVYVFASKYNANNLCEYACWCLDRLLNVIRSYPQRVFDFITLIRYVIFSPPTFKFLFGPEKNGYPLHTYVVLLTSRPLKALMEERASEGAGEYAWLEDVDEDTFDRFAHFLYTATYALNHVYVGNSNNSGNPKVKEANGVMNRFRCASHSRLLLAHAKVSVFAASYEVPELLEMSHRAIQEYTLSTTAGADLTEDMLELVAYVDKNPRGEAGGELKKAIHGFLVRNARFLTRGDDNRVAIPDLLAVVEEGRM